MTRSLFFAFFLRLAIAMAAVALLQVVFGRAAGLPLLLLIPALAALTAQWMARSLQRSIDPLEQSAAALYSAATLDPATTPSPSALATHSSAAPLDPAQLDPPHSHPPYPHPAKLPLDSRFRDFDDLAYALATASGRVQAVLAGSVESRHELEALLDSMQDSIVAVDAAGRIQWANQRMQRLMPGASVSNASVSSASGSSASVTSSVRVGHALVQTIRDPDVLECVRTALEQRTISERRSTSLLPGRIFEVSASPMPGGGAVAVLHDITRIEEVERTQRDFVANVSHELRTPLTSISGYVETLLDHEDSLSSQARDFLSTILKNATRMNRLTEDLLVMARVESAEQELHPAPVRSDLLVHDAVKAMSGLVQDNDATLEIGDVTPCQVFADADAVLQVLSNLIENAVKYGRPRPPLPCRVLVSAREIEEPYAAVEFSVRDFGQGIASEHLNRIFERFYRVDKARSRESGGTGLGLAIAQHMIHAQGGAIRAESEMNAGSTFLFTIPKAMYPIP